MSSKSGCTIVLVDGANTPNLRRHPRTSPIIALHLHSCCLSDQLSKVARPCAHIWVGTGPRGEGDPRLIPFENPPRKLRTGITSRSHGVGTRQIVLAWLLNTSPQILPIPGSGSPDHVAENIAAASVQLTSLPMTPPGPWVVIPHVL